jgi:hypothetical protein
LEKWLAQTILHFSGITIRDIVKSTRVGVQAKSPKLLPCFGARASKTIAAPRQSLEKENWNALPKLRSSLVEERPSKSTKISIQKTLSVYGKDFPLKAEDSGKEKHRASLGSL